MHPRGQPVDDRENSPSRQASVPEADPTLRALEDLVAAAEQMARLTQLIREQAAEIRACRGQGLPYRQVVEHESRPLIAAAVTDVIARFEASSTRFRQAKAAALREEGMTLEDIGQLFGVTRQRISGLLQAADSNRPEP